ncbi:MAG: type II toxin-antitoxin system VapC family toxin [Chloroflexi bacterium]|nr:type II toxin-antitoxin system VapC family toxin [Chloroflexota bacterium]
MTDEAVLDASVVLKWLKAEGEQQLAAAQAWERLFRAGMLFVTVPSLLFLEIVNIAARRLRWDAERVAALAVALGQFGFAVQEPSLGRVAYWTTQGLTAYDACYVALAEERGVPLITADDHILAIAGTVARPLGAGLEPAEGTEVPSTERRTPST